MDSKHPVGTAMSKHIHAELMVLYGQDAMETDRPWERWEVDVDEDEDGYGYYRWSSLSTHPTWHPDRKYRRKPRTININGHEVPEPVRKPLVCETEYFIPAISGQRFELDYHWADDEADKRFLDRGLVHLTKEAATAHVKALLSFTAKPEVSDE